MRAIFGLVLLLGLGLAGFAVYMVKGQFEQQERQIAQERAVAAQQIRTVNIVAVNRRLQYGDLIQAGDLVTIPYTADHLPAGTFASLEEVFTQGETVHRSVLRQMEVNEPLLAVKVTAPGVVAGLTHRLDPGMRAFTISTDATSSISGFLRPGDRVDVYWTGVIETESEEVTKLIETAVEIVAIDQTADADLAEVEVARTATVQVTPQQVANLAQAQATGALSIALVGVEDDGSVEVVDVTQRRLLGLPEPIIVEETQIAAPMIEAVCTVRTRRGSDVVDHPIACTN